MNKKCHKQSSIMDGFWIMVCQRCKTCARRISLILYDPYSERPYDISALICYSYVYYRISEIKAHFYW